MIEIGSKVSVQLNGELHYGVVKELKWGMALVKLEKEQAWITESKLNETTRCGHTEK